MECDIVISTFFHYFDLNKTAAEAHQLISDIYGE